MGGTTTGCDLGSYYKSLEPIFMQQGLLIKDPAWISPNLFGFFFGVVFSTFAGSPKHYDVISLDTFTRPKQKPRRI